MKLNNLKPAMGSTQSRRRIGRGTGSGLGGTSTRGHKGAKSRSGYKKKIGFEGGQMPLQRRLPKRGFKSLTAAANAEVRLSELNLIAVHEIDVLVLKQAGLIPATASNVKVIASGEISKAVTLKGVKATKGAKAAIEAAGGKVEE